MTKSQIILTWSRDSIDFIGTQLKDYIELKSVDGWCVHQIINTVTDFSNEGHTRLMSCLIIMHRHFDYSSEEG